MAAMTAAEQALAELLIRSLNLEDKSPADIDPTAPMFGTQQPGWGLDSIDALEIALAVQQAYGVELKADEPATRAALTSLRALSEHIARHRRG